MVGRDIGKRIACESANRSTVHLHTGYLVTCGRSDRKGLACPGIYLDGSGREIAPFVPAAGVIVKVPEVNVAEIVWLAVTSVKVWLTTAPIDAPSTFTLATWYLVAGVIVKVWLAPEFTVTLPGGEIVPFELAVALIV